MIKNRDALARSPARTDALSILSAGLAALDTRRVLTEVVHLTDTELIIGETRVARDDMDRLFVVGVGKCAVSAVEVLEDILGDAITDGVVVDVRCSKRLRRVRSCEGTHPYPSEENVAFTRALLELLASAGERDIVIAVISGGGSTLLCQPTTHTCQDERVLLEHLFARGATIQEVNTIRKHLSLARGGHLAAAAYPARLVSLIYSDVPGDELSFIASGPTVKDDSTVQDAQRVARRYQCDHAIGFLDSNFMETPKDDELFSRTTNLLVVTNQTALTAMERCAHELGYTARIVQSDLYGEAREVALRVMEELHREAPPAVLLYGGETTVTLAGSGGQGGRNQELALAALAHIREGEVLISCATDGWDNGDHAGALVDRFTRERARERGLDPTSFLADNDSYTFFHTVGDALKTGYTGINVSDVVVALSHT